MELKIPKTLKEAIYNSKVIPFVGAGVSKAVRDLDQRPIFPDWNELFEKGAEELTEQGVLGSEKLLHLIGGENPDYYKAADLLKASLKSRLWHDFLKKAFAPKYRRIDHKSLGLQRAIWALDPQLVITTNYDNCLYWTRPDHQETLKWNVESPVSMSDHALKPDPKKKVIWHLHGCIDESSRIILTSERYEELYRYNEVKRQQYQAALHLLRHYVLTEHLLFIGFSMKDRFFVEFLSDWSQAFDDSVGPHYALVHERELEDFEKIARDLPVQAIIFEDFGAPLLDLVNKLSLFRNLTEEKERFLTRQELIANSSKRRIKLCSFEDDEVLYPDFGAAAFGWLKTLKNGDMRSLWRLTSPDYRKVLSYDWVLHNLEHESFKGACRKFIADFLADEAPKGDIAEAMLEILLDQFQSYWSDYQETTWGISHLRRVVQPGYELACFTNCDGRTIELDSDKGYFRLYLLFEKIGNEWLMAGLNDEIPKPIWPLPAVIENTLSISGSKLKDEFIQKQVRSQEEDLPAVSLDGFSTDLGFLAAFASEDMKCFLDNALSKIFQVNSNPLAQEFARCFKDLKPDQFLEALKKIIPQFPQFFDRENNDSIVDVFKNLQPQQEHLFIELFRKSLTSRFQT